MTGLQKIIDQINNDSKISAAKIEEDAKARSAEIINNAKKDGEKMVKHIEENTSWQCADILQRGKSSAALKKKKTILKAKQQIITEVISKALESLYSLNDKEYFDTIYKMIRKNSLKQNGEIAFNQKDIARLPKDFSEKLLENANGKLTLAKQPINIKGGFVLIYGGIEENCSFEAMFASADEKLQDDVHNLLFS